MKATWNYSEYALSPQPAPPNFRNPETNEPRVVSRGTLYMNKMMQRKATFNRKSSSCPDSSSASIRSHRTYPVGSLLLPNQPRTPPGTPLRHPFDPLLDLLHRLCHFAAWCFGGSCDFSCINSSSDGSGTLRSPNNLLRDLRDSSRGVAGFADGGVLRGGWVAFRVWFGFCGAVCAGVGGLAADGFSPRFRGAERC